MKDNRTSQLWFQNYVVFVSGIMVLSRFSIIIIIIIIIIKRDYIRFV